MMGNKFFTINGINFKCQGYDGYNGHYYCTVYNDSTGEYIGQIADCNIHDSDSSIYERLNSFLNLNYF